MNDAYRQVIAATDDERRELFLATARHLGTAVENVEKDFWVCWTLYLLFNGLGSGLPRLLFKGGTSLSKSFGLIDRFSEDIDITVFRADLGEPASVAELEMLSGKKRRARLDAIRSACQAFINGPFLRTFNEVMTSVMASARVTASRYRADPIEPTPTSKPCSSGIRSSLPEPIPTFARRSDRGWCQVCFGPHVDDCHAAFVADVAALT